LNFVVANTVKRLIHIIREECRELKIDKLLVDANKPRAISGMSQFGKVSSNLPRASDDSNLFTKFDRSSLVNDVLSFNRPAFERKSTNLPMKKKIIHRRRNQC